MPRSDRRRDLCPPTSLMPSAPAKIDLYGDPYVAAYPPASLYIQHCKASLATHVAKTHSKNQETKTSKIEEQRNRKRKPPKKKKISPHPDLNWGPRYQKPICCQLHHEALLMCSKS